MGKFNEFLVPIECPKCGATAEQSSEERLNKVGVAAPPETFRYFQAKAGVLRYDAFRLGDRVIPEGAVTGAIEPVQLLSGQDFWVTGVSECGRCEVRLWARIEVRQGVFARLSLVDEPDDVLSWGLLDPSG